MSKLHVVATGEIKIIESKGKKHGFQVCKLVEADGGYQKFEAYFNPAKGSFHVEPGIYDAIPSDPKVVDGRLVCFVNFQPQPKQAAKAA